MTCLTPISLFRRENIGLADKYAVDLVPCGKCPACLKRRQSGWTFRLEKEQMVSESSAFLTLTYDDKNLPISENGYHTLYKKHHQLFLKRLRETLKRNFFGHIRKPLKYYSCGEYGSKTYRPHYHSIMFNLPKEYIDNPELLDIDWKYGQTLITECNAKTINYVTKYINKTMYTERPEELIDVDTGEILIDDRVKEFSLMSKGLGKDYLTPQTVKYYQKKQIPYLTIENGDKRPMPRYYKDKLYNKEVKHIIKEKTLEHLEKKPEFQNELQKIEYIVQKFREQKKKNTLDRQKL